ncbi:MAG: serine/threonine protein kinase [Planctomycetes bacterium]|nr:serine/threonine protein kinase [Planctomycetota bacterium]
MEEVFTDAPADDVPDGPVGPARFGDVAVAMKLLTNEQVAELLAKQKADKELGFPKRLDEIAVELNFLAKVECDLVLEELRKRRNAARPDAGTGSNQELVVPCQLGALEVEQRIFGPLGTLYRAYDKGRNKDIAIKVIPPVLGSDSSWWDKVKFESRVASRLSHPNMVTMYAADEVEGRKIVVLDYVEGEPLINRVTEQGVLREREALGYARGLAFALYHAHVVGLVYRDVQPSMAVIDQAGRVRLYGLGLSKFYTEDHELAESGLVIANPFYLAPEVLSGEDEGSPAADLYSLGATFFHLVCGHPPYEGAPDEVKQMHISEPIPDPGQFAPNLSKYARGMIMKLLAKDPAERYAGADHVAGAIDKLMAPVKLQTGGGASSSGNLAVGAAPVAPAAPPADMKQLPPSDELEPLDFDS